MFFEGVTYGTGCVWPNLLPVDDLARCGAATTIHYLVLCKAQSGTKHHYTLSCTQQHGTKRHNFVELLFSFVSKLLHKW